VDMIKVLNEKTNGLTCMSKLIQADQKSILIQCLSFSTLEIVEISTLTQYYLAFNFQPLPK